MSEEGKSSGIRILVVEDSAMSFTLTSAMIERIMGVVPDRAHDGEEAVSMLQKQCYELVFMDYFMPKMNGIEATRLIREDPIIYQQPTIIGLSGAAAPRDIHAFENAGMDHFLAKPLRLFQIEDMLMKITHQQPQYAV